MEAGNDFTSVRNTQTYKHTTAIITSYLIYFDEHCNITVLHREQHSFEDERPSQDPTISSTLLTVIGLNICINIRVDIRSIGLHFPFLSAISNFHLHLQDGLTLHTDTHIVSLSTKNKILSLPYAILSIFTEQSVVMCCYLLWRWAVTFINRWFEERRRRRRKPQHYKTYKTVDDTQIQRLKLYTALVHISQHCSNWVLDTNFSVVTNGLVAFTSKRALQCVQSFIGQILALMIIYCTGKIKLTTVQ